MTDNTTKNTIMIVFLVVVLALGYWYFFTGDDGFLSGLFGADAPSQAATLRSQEAQELVQLLHEFQDIKIDPTIMDRIPHGSLRDFHLEVPIGTRGRTNPFAPSDALPNPSTQ